MKKRAKITIEYRGRKYRLSHSTRCASKRDCDLFKHGLCDDESGEVTFCDLPCADLHDAIHCDVFAEVNSGFKEVNE